MRYFERRGLLGSAVLLMTCLITFNARAGGSGLNTVVIVNRNSSNSCELANYFCERRQVPPENVLPIVWPGGNISWSSGEFQTNLLDPLLTMLAGRQLTNQIDYVVLSMDIPFQTVNGSSVNGTTTALFYGLKSDSGADSTANSYAASEGIFQNVRPTNAPGYSFLTTMITADSLAQAKLIVDHGVTSDGTFPTNPVVLAKSSDALRNIRYHAFDNAIFNTRVRGNYFMQRTNSDSPAGQAGLLGYQTGLAGFNISPNTFVPGAMADSMTSFGGIILEPNGQTSLMAFLNAGAAGSYGTVTEPYAVADKFPDPQVYFYQSRGFSLAECYYQGLVTPFQGLIVGEPLAAPFSRPASGQWLSPAPNSVLNGTAPLSVRFTANDGDHPLQQVDLFVDGKYFRTLTNRPPAAGNLLRITLNGSTLSYTVPPNATIGLVASGLAALVNAPVNTNATGISASLHGDRVELRYVLTNRSTPPVVAHLLPGASSAPTNPASGPTLVSSSIGTGSSLSTFLVATRNTFLPSPIPGFVACSVNGSLQIGTWLQINVTKPNGAQISLSVTNQSVSNRPIDLAGQLVTLINSAPGLQDLDGIIAEDLAAGVGAMARFNVRARGQGYKTALKMSLTGSSALFLAPGVSQPLIDNLPDVQPRNHVYVAAGTTNFTLTFPLDTTALADGFHELTAVAYEGSHVRTQTRVTLPIRIQNTSLTADLNLLDLPATAPAAGTYHVQVTANAPNISAITLFSNGGALSTASNQTSATFTVNGSTQGAGLLPFYAVVQTSTGLGYRTPTQWVRLTN